MIFSLLYFMLSLSSHFSNHQTLLVENLRLAEVLSYNHTGITVYWQCRNNGAIVLFQKYYHHNKMYFLSMMNLSNRKFYYDFPKLQLFYLAYNHKKVSLLHFSATCVLNLTDFDNLSWVQPTSDCTFTIVNKPNKYFIQ